jgi:hypothetical protein
LTGLTYLVSRLSAGPQFKSKWHFYLAVFAFSNLGFVTGSIMSDSRDSAVSAVLPAVLTLMGGVAAFLIGSKGVEKQATVSVLILVFSLALYSGSFYGAELRVENETSVNYDLDLENNRHAVEVQRLLNYIELMSLKRDLANQNDIDLSGFAIDNESKTKKENKK